MADTYTTILNLTKPEVGASADTWGTKLNANFDTLDGLFDSGPYLAVDAGGTGAGTAAGARTSLGLGTMATQNASAVAITGGTATLSGLTTSSAAPYVSWYQSDGGTNEKYTYIYCDGTLLDFRFYDDSVSSYTSPITVQRSGKTPTSIALTATTFTLNGNAVYHAGSSIPETIIADGSLLARVGSNETVTGTWTFSTAPSVPAATVTAHQASLTIAESQITDGSVLARVAGNETISGNWTFSGTITKSGQGRIPYLVGSGNTGGAITVSTSDASGTPANGDLWIKYTA